MSKESIHRNNPLQGVGLKQVLEELVTYYGFDILYAYLNMNCFKSNPSIAACTKFLKKTEWAREKVEIFYLYQYKNLPKVSSEQFTVAPRERIVPAHHKPGEPAILSIEDGEQLRHKREKNVASRNSHAGKNHQSSRQYNHRRSTGTSRFADNHRGDESSDTDESDSHSGGGASVEDSKSAPAIDPWGFYKEKQ